MASQGVRHIRKQSAEPVRIPEDGVVRVGRAIALYEPPPQYADPLFGVPDRLAHEAYTRLRQKGAKAPPDWALHDPRRASDAVQARFKLMGVFGLVAHTLSGDKKAVEVLRRGGWISLAKYWVDTGRLKPLSALPEEFLLDAMIFGIHGFRAYRCEAGHVYLALPKPGSRRRWCWIHAHHARREASRRWYERRGRERRKRRHGEKRAKRALRRSPA